MRSILKQGQLVELGVPCMDEPAGQIGACVRIDGEHYGLLFRGGAYDEFTPEQLRQFDVRPLSLIDEDASMFKFVGVVRTMQHMARGGFTVLRTAVFPNGVPYADQP
ncbi:MAG: hypothetical protein ACRC9H_15245 [Aeromonas veronii]